MDMLIKHKENYKNFIINYFEKYNNPLIMIYINNLFILNVIPIEYHIVAFLLFEKINSKDLESFESLEASEASEDFEDSLFLNYYMSLVITDKVLNDITINEYRYYAELINISYKKLKLIEYRILKLIDYDVNIREESYNEFLLKLN